jgi:hypothetical protein
VSVPPTAEDFVTATQNFLAELRDLGGDVAPTTRLVYSEAGIGGGYPKFGDGGPQYPTVAEVAAKPYEGRGHGRLNPWRDAELAKLRAEYHAALCDYLKNGGSAPRSIDKAFLWSEGPWDPQGVATRRSLLRSTGTTPASPRRRPGKRTEIARRPRLVCYSMAALLLGGCSAG